MIFPRNPKGPALPSEKKRLPTLPCSSRSVNGCMCFPVFSIRVLVILISIRHGKQKEPPERTALFCKVMFEPVWYIRFILPVSLENQITENAEKYRSRYQQAGDFVDKPEESLETHDGDCRPYGRYTPCIQVAEHDKGCNGQRYDLYPFARSVFSDTFPCFHDRILLMGETCHFQFQGPESGPPPPARFSGKIPERSEDDFCRNLQGPTLRVETGGSATFALELEWQCAISLSRPWVWGTRVSG